MKFDGKKFFKEWVLTLGIAFIVAMFFRTVIASPRHIPTGSMIPTIKIGEFIFVQMFAYDWHIPFTRQSMIKRSDPKRGDVVVFEHADWKNPDEPPKDFIKRVVGVPGDTIEMQENRIFINGKPLPFEVDDNREILKDLDEQYQLSTLQLYKEKIGDVEHHAMYISNIGRENYPQFKVPPDSYFVMGDNRDNSHDSRFWGRSESQPWDFVRRDKILGQATFIWFSFDIDHLPFVRFERLFTWVN